MGPASSKTDCLRPRGCGCTREPAVFTGTEDAGVISIAEAAQRFHADAVPFVLCRRQAVFIEGYGPVEAVLDQDAEDVALAESQQGIGRGGCRAAFRWRGWRFR